MLEYNKCVKMSVNNNGFINQECIGSKKKTAFITVHVGENFGSALQAIATQRVLEQVDTEPTLINYIPPRVTFSGFLKSIVISLSLFIRVMILLRSVQKPTATSLVVIRCGTLSIMRGLMSITSSKVFMVARFPMQHQWE